MELLDGWTGPLISNQLLFNLLDGVPIVSSTSPIFRRIRPFSPADDHPPHLYPPRRSPSSSSTSSTPCSSSSMSSHFFSFSFILAFTDLLLSFPFSFARRATSSPTMTKISSPMELDNDSMAKQPHYFTSSSSLNHQHEYQPQQYPRPMEQAPAMQQQQQHQRGREPVGSGYW